MYGLLRLQGFQRAILIYGCPQAVDTCGWLSKPSKLVVCNTHSVILNNHNLG